MVSTPERKAPFRVLMDADNRTLLPDATPLGRRISSFYTRMDRLTLNKLPERNEQVDPEFEYYPQMEVGGTVADLPQSLSDLVNYAGKEVAPETGVSMCYERSRYTQIWVPFDCFAVYWDAHEPSDISQIHIEPLLRTIKSINNGTDMEDPPGTPPPPELFRQFILKDGGGKVVRPGIQSNDPAYAAEAARVEVVLAYVNALNPEEKLQILEDLVAVFERRLPPVLLQENQ